MAHHVLLKVADERAADRATLRVEPHLHHLRCGVSISAILGRRDNVLLEELLDVLIRASYVVGTLRLIHQFLHDIREFDTCRTALSVFHVGFELFRVKEVRFGDQMALLLRIYPAALRMVIVHNCVIGFSIIGCPFIDIKRADCFRGGHRLEILGRWHQFPILVSQGGQDVDLALWTPGSSCTSFEGIKEQTLDKLRSTLTGRQSIVDRNDGVVGHCNVLRCVQLATILLIVALIDQLDDFIDCDGTTGWLSLSICGILLLVLSGLWLGSVLLRIALPRCVIEVLINSASFGVAH